MDLEVVKIEASSSASILLPVEAVRIVCIGFLVLGDFF